MPERPEMLVPLQQEEGHEWHECEEWSGGMQVNQQEECNDPDHMPENNEDLCGGNDQGSDAGGCTTYRCGCGSSIDLSDDEIEMSDCDTITRRQWKRWSRKHTLRREDLTPKEKIEITDTPWSIASVIVSVISIICSIFQPAASKLVLKESCHPCQIVNQRPRYIRRGTH
jgi:hypothetical protein